MDDLKFRTKLIGAFTMLALCSALVGYIGRNAIEALATDLNSTLDQGVDPLVRASSIRYYLMKTRGDVWRLIGDPATADRNQMVSEFDEEFGKLQGLVAQLDRDPLPANERALFEEFVAESKFSLDARKQAIRMPD